jgi:hypothetical protein
MFLTNANGDLVDLNLNAISDASKAVPVYRDSFTGGTYAQVCEVIPSGNATADIASRTEIEALKPIHSSDPLGWFIALPLSVSVPVQVPQEA